MSVKAKYECVGFPGPKTYYVDGPELSPNVHAGHSENGGAVRIRVTRSRKPRQDAAADVWSAFSADDRRDDLVSPCLAQAHYEEDGIYTFVYVDPHYPQSLREVWPKMSEHEKGRAISSLVDILRYVHEHDVAIGVFSSRTLSVLDGRVILTDLGNAARLGMPDAWIEDPPFFTHTGHPDLAVMSMREHASQFPTAASDMQTLVFNLALWTTGTLPWIGDSDERGVYNKKRAILSSVTGVDRLFSAYKGSPSTLAALKRYASTVLSSHDMMCARYPASNGVSLFI